MTRQEANILIAQILLNCAKDPEYGQLRFGQLLAVLHITDFEYDDSGNLKYPKDIFNEESIITLKRINESNL